MTFKKMALRAGLYSSAAIAAFVAFESSVQAGTFAGSAITYAGLAVSANNNIVTLPAYTYTVASASNGALPASGESLVFTFPTGISAATTPGLVVTQVCTGSTVSSTYAPTYSSNTVTFSLPTQATTLCAAASGTTPVTVTLPALTVSGATGLAVTGASTATFTVTAKLTSVTTALQDTTAVADTSVKAIVGATVTPTLPTGTGTSLAISLSTANLGTKFNGVGGGTSLTAQLASTVAAAAAASAPVNASGPGNAYTLSASSIGLTVTGTFTTGIASAYLAPSGTSSCSTTVPSGSFTSTSVTAGSITFGSMNATTWGALCLIATGTGIIQPSTNVLVQTISSGTATNVSLGTTSLQGYTFTGGAIKSLPYLIGAQAGYASVIRLINTDTSTPASVFLSVTSEAGVTNTYQSTPLTTVAANTSLTTTLEGLATAGSTTFLASGARGTANLLVAGTSSVSAQAYILQPGNLLLNVGAGPTITSTTNTQTATYTNSAGVTANYTLTIPGATSTSGNAISF
jgi:hypothetical protein